MEDKLKSIFSNVNDWLKFAEAKNAALITLCGAGIWGILQVLKDKNNLADYKYILVFMLCILFTSLIISLTSFIAKIFNDPCPKGLVENALQLNLLFYGHICKLTPQEYLESIYSKYANQRDYESCPPYEQDLANQIVVNCEIVVRKYTLFNKSIKLLLFGLLFSIFGFVIIA